MDSIEQIKNEIKYLENRIPKVIGTKFHGIFMHNLSTLKEQLKEAENEIPLNKYTCLVNFETVKILVNDYNMPLPKNEEDKTIDPTIAHVLDWLLSKGVFINFIPFHTFALKEGIGFTYTIWTIDESGVKEVFSEPSMDGGSFPLMANEAILMACDVLK